MIFFAIEWQGGSTCTATWIENLVGTVPQTTVEVSDVCCQFASEPVGQTSVGLEPDECTKPGYPGSWQVLAQDQSLWMQLRDDFAFCSPIVDVLSQIACAPRGGCLRTCKRKVKSKWLAVVTIKLPLHRWVVSVLLELDAAQQQTP